MNIVIPMAGHGRRFADSGHAEPKPLVMVKGRPLVWWAVQGLPEVPPDKMIFIVHTDHVRQFGIEERLREIFSPQVRILAQDLPPEGPAATVLQAREWIGGDEPLLIHNCDTHAPEIARCLRQVLCADPALDGVIPVFRSQDPDLSYVGVDSAGLATEVAEKVVISENASVGTYYFRRGMDFVAAAMAMIAAGRRVRGEFYVLPVYQDLIAQGRRFRIVSLDSVVVLGTPTGVMDFASR